MSLLFNRITVLTLTTLVAGASAQAQGRPSVLILDRATPVALMGKGVIDEQGDWMALKCNLKAAQNPTADDCTSFQTVYYNKAADHLWEVGPSFNKENLQPTFKKLGKAFTRQWRHHHGAHSLAMAGLILGVPALIATGGLIGVLPLVASLNVFAAWMGGAMLVGPALGNNPTTLYSHSNALQTPMQDQSGFNWSSKPEKISHKKMYAYLNFIMQAADRNSGFSNPADAMPGVDSGESVLETYRCVESSPTDAAYIPEVFSSTQGSTLVSNSFSFAGCRAEGRLMMKSPDGTRMNPFYLPREEFKQSHPDHHYE